MGGLVLRLGSGWGGGQCGGGGGGKGDRGRGKGVRRLFVDALRFLIL